LSEKDANQKQGGESRSKVGEMQSEEETPKTPPPKKKNKKRRGWWKGTGLEQLERKEVDLDGDLTGVSMKAL